MPSVNDRLSAACFSIGLAGLHLFALGLWWHRAVAIAGIVLMLAGLLRPGVGWRRFGRIASVQAVILWLLYLAFQLATVAVTDTAPFRMHWEAALRWSYLAGFLLVAYYLQGQCRRIFSILAWAVAGFFLGRLAYLDELLQHGYDFWRFRHQLGFPTAIPLGQYAATVLLILLILGPRFLACRGWGARAAWLLGLAIATECVFLSQSRGVWGALLGVLVLVSVSARRMVSPLWRQYRKAVVLVAALGLVVGMGQYSVLAHRLAEEGQTYRQLLHGNVAAIPMQRADGSEYSIGVRVAMWRFGIVHWLERPWFGWGPAGTRHLIACCAPEVFRRFNDLHSAPVELLLRFGVVGLVLAAAVGVTAVTPVLQALRTRRLPADVFLLVMAALSLHGLLALVNFRMLNYDWRFFWFLYGGIAASFAFVRENDREIETSHRSVALRQGRGEKTQARREGEAAPAEVSFRALVPGRTVGPAPLRFLRGLRPASKCQAGAGAPPAEGNGSGRLPGVSAPFFPL